MDFCPKKEIDTGFELFGARRVRPYPWFDQKVMGTYFSFFDGRVVGCDYRYLVDNFRLWVKTSKMSYTSSFAPKKKWTPDLSFKDVHGSNHVVGSKKKM